MDNVLVRSLNELNDYQSFARVIFIYIGFGLILMGVVSVYYQISIFLKKHKTSYLILKSVGASNQMIISVVMIEFMILSSLVAILSFGVSLVIIDVISKLNMARYDMVSVLSIEVIGYSLGICLVCLGMFGVVFLGVLKWMLKRFSIRCMILR